MKIETFGGSDESLNLVILPKQSANSDFFTKINHKDIILLNDLLRNCPYSTSSLVESVLVEKYNDEVHAIHFI